MLHNALNRRDGVLILIGVSCIYILSAIFSQSIRNFPSIVVNTLPQFPAHSTDDLTPQPDTADISLAHSLPQTSIIAHAPGWTLFRNLYMSNGTLYLLSSDPTEAGFPEIRMMTSTGRSAENTPENIASREPTSQEMDFISPEEAKSLWGGDISDGEKNRIWSIKGNTILYNDPPQFLDHYYHFVAELLLGTRAFLYGAFNPSSASSPAFISSSSDAYEPPPFSRAIFIHSNAEGWRDKPGFNAYFLRAVFPSLTVEVARDWADRVDATAPPKPPNKNDVQHSRDIDMEILSSGRAWHFPVALLADRSASFRGEACGSRTQRTAAEAWEYMVNRGRIDAVGTWWNSVREAIWIFAGVGRTSDPEDAQLMHPEKRQNRDDSEADDVATDPQLQLPKPKDIVITYLSRQGVRRRLRDEDHEGLVAALSEMVKRKREDEGKEWALNIVKPESLSKDDQIKLVAKTTVLLGVHGNGLTHLVLMKPSRLSAVIEILYPGGFAHDYEWTTTALGMRHFTVWNDTYFTRPNEPPIGYGEGFHGTSIPAHGPSIARLIEDRLEGLA